MRVAVFSAKPYDRRFLQMANEAVGSPYHFEWIEAQLGPRSALQAAGARAACLFVNDRADATALAALHEQGVRLVALRCAGFNNVDLAAASRLGIAVARVPAYAPEAVAEHAAALVLSLSRRMHKAYARVREGNFALDGLLGLDLHGRCVGIIGTGQIGLAFARIMHGFGCRLLAHDPAPSQDAIRRLGIEYRPLAELLADADIISLHCPLTPATNRLIDAAALTRMKRGAMLINTSRGAMLDTTAVIAALKSGHLGHLGLDVYEEEADLFFEDLSGTVLQDDVFARLLTFPNVLITGHQGFFTEGAMRAIAATTLANLDAFAAGRAPLHAVPLPEG
ncbi:2-hydroxyacid dehydrogenase [Teichococcus oryzae]|uniref:2-hydroxyacid dehydrogenase n=1 Tax=Teichococcus oryzae TaxID=1608942 RepID=A0A5B2TCA0_9PROT|nr:2-hydroxyacid dehydrogenase [Pseudoroseomonas oryzae]KAA2212107.1 2-hydroxyacid dehydrogenase [Pseudoroseomonas oryzae]